MLGSYRLIDDSEYEVYYDEVREEKKTITVLLARCTKSKTKTDKPFKIREADIDRNVRHNLWIKID